MVDFARTVLNRRLLGRLTAARFHVSVPAPDAVTPWFNLKDDIGGVLFEDGCHMLDIVLHLMGRPDKVSAFVSKFDDLKRKFSARAGQKCGSRAWSCSWIATAAWRPPRR